MLARGTLLAGYLFAMLTIKAWTNKDTNLVHRCNFSTCVDLCPCLARTCMHLRWLTVSRVHFFRDQICTQVIEVFHFWPLEASTELQCGQWFFFDNLREWVSKRVGGWESGWVREWVGGWVSGWGSGWVSELVGGWVTKWVKCTHISKIARFAWTLFTFRNV